MENVAVSTLPAADTLRELSYEGFLHKEDWLRCGSAPQCKGLVTFILGHTTAEEDPKSPATCSVSYGSGGKLWVHFGVVSDVTSANAH